jgi:hypothetical protein
MRLIVSRSIAVLAAIAISVAVPTVRADNSIVVRPDEFAAIEAKGQVVEVVIKGPKAKQLADKTRHTTIQFSVPFPDEHAVLTGEPHFARNVVTLSFQFPTKSSAADFAAMLKTARAKILSDCDCH